MNDQDRKTIFSNVFTIGTSECAIFSAVVAMVLALLLLSVGFWKALLVAALMVVGGFLGGVRNKRQWLKDVINRLFPARSIVPYREQNPEIARAVRRATEAKEKEAPAADAEETTAAEEAPADQPANGD